jgi:ribose transport system substrate-binding protein
VDTDAPFDKKVTYIGTNNRRGGQLAAKGLAEAIGSAHAEVALISGVPGNESQDERALGFIDAVASEYPNLKLVAQQPGNSERALGLTVMENILTAHPGVKGVFATNDQMALGAMEALEAAACVARSRSSGSMPRRKRCRRRSKDAWPAAWPRTRT